MIRRPPRSTRTDTLLPYTTLFRSGRRYVGALCSSPLMASADIPDGSQVDLAPLTGAGLAAPESPTPAVTAVTALIRRPPPRSEEHTSELQSLMRISYAVFCLKKKNT